VLPDAPTITPAVLTRLPHSLLDSDNVFDEPKQYKFM